MPPATRVVNAIALVAVGVVIGLSIQQPAGTTAIQEAPPAARAQDDDDDGGAGTFLNGNTFYAGPRPQDDESEPPRPRPPTDYGSVFRWKLPVLDDPWWSTTPPFPCDTSRRTMGFNRGRPFVARFSPTADGSASPDTVVFGDDSRLCAPRDIAFGPAGELYVLDGYRRPRDLAGETLPSRTHVMVYDRGTTRDDDPERVFSIADALAMAVDSAGQVWTSAGAATRVIRVYGPDQRGEAEPVRTITGRSAESNRVFGLAVDSRGNSYAAGDNEVVVYSPSTGDGEPPVRTITGPDTFLRRPADLAIGPGDSLFVLNAFGYWRCGSMAPSEVTVTVYPPDADGNVEPARLMVVTQAGKSAGSPFAITRPARLAVDAAGAVYVSFDSRKAIAVFAPGAKGIVSPVRMLRMDGTNADPGALAVGKDGAVYVTAFPSPTICL